MYTSPFSLVLGFHGCDREVGEQVLCGAETHLRGSEGWFLGVDGLLESSAHAVSAWKARPRWRALNDRGGVADE